jgi:hypothetical protein
MSCKGKNIILLFFITTFFVVSSKAEEIPHQKFLINPRCFVAVPHPLMDKALRNSFIGIYDFNPSLNINPFGGFEIGAAYKHTAMSIPANKIPGLQKTRMILNNVGIRMGYDQYYSKTVFFSYFLNFGESFASFKGVPCATPMEGGYKYSAIYLEPEFSVNFLIEDFFAIGICASFNYSEHIFNPSSICLNDYASYLNSDMKYPTGLLNVGFGFFYGFQKKK